MSLSWGNARQKEKLLGELSLDTFRHSLLALAFSARTPGSPGSRHSRHIRAGQDSPCPSAPLRLTVVKLWCAATVLLYLDQVMVNCLPSGRAGPVEGGWGIGLGSPPPPLWPHCEALTAGRGPETS